MGDLRGLPYEKQKQILRARKEAQKRKAQEESNLEQDDSKQLSENGGTKLATTLVSVEQKKRNNSDIDDIVSSNAALSVDAVADKTSGRQFEVQLRPSKEHASQPSPPKKVRFAGTPYVDDRRRLSKPVGSSIIPRSTLAELITKPKAGIRGGCSAEDRGTTGQYPFKEKIALPGWLHSISIKATIANRSLLVSLSKVRDVIILALKAEGADQEKRFDQIRKYLHQYEHETVDAALVKRSHLLEPKGLPQLFGERIDEFKFPHDIRADAKILFNKWAQEDFNADIMRGLIWKKSSDKGRNSTSLDAKYPNRISWKFFGEGGLVSGQWWPLLLACLRDGVHGSAEAGISHYDDRGATSVIVSNSQYDDVDEGDVLWYCGTEGKDGKTTHDTRALHDNIRSGEPVRVLRSHNLPKTNQYRPSVGFRYDGLYDVKSYKVLDAETAHHRFRLERRPDQDPIRWCGLGARPTDDDKEAYQLHKARLNA